MLVFYRPRHPKKMFYQRLTLPIHELENKRQLKCTFMSIDQKEEKEVTLYPNKGSRIEQMLEEAKQVKIVIQCREFLWVHIIASERIILTNIIWSWIDFSMLIWIHLVLDQGSWGWWTSYHIRFIVSIALKHLSMHWQERARKVTA